MNTQTTSQYLLLFRGIDWHKGMSPEEIQAVTSKFLGWFERLTSEGKAKAGQPLLPEGKVVSGRNGRVVADGPFAESKETIGGYFLLQVNDMNEAVAIAQECPGLSYGLTVEVRPVAAECPVAKSAREQLARATA